MEEQSARMYVFSCNEVKICVEFMTYIGDSSDVPTRLPVKYQLEDYFDMCIRSSFLIVG